jgi:hypothetical protein
VTTKRQPWVVWRDRVIVFTSLSLIAYEAILYSGDPRQPLLILYGGMLGLPAFLRADERRKSDSERP